MTEDFNSPVTITLQDLALALQVIKVTAERGGFKAEELATVGGLHDRIQAFLVANGGTPEQEEQQEEQQESQEQGDTAQ